MLRRLAIAALCGLLAGGTRIGLAKGADTKPAPAAQPGPLRWQPVAPGFAVADLPVMEDGQLVDHILLARISPAAYRFVVLNQPAAPLPVDQWVTRLGAALVVNGSYYTPGLTPDTPILSQGVILGPPDYHAHAGAFIAGPAFTGVRSLASGDWRGLFAQAQNGMVSYPLLVADGAPGITRPSQRVARRSFVGQDNTGRIIIGTTAGAAFTLPALAAFLVRAPLGLTMALNLDGGPVACQSISLGRYTRRAPGAGELSACTLPIVLAVLPR